MSKTSLVTSQSLVKSSSLVLLGALLAPTFVVAANAETGNTESAPVVSTQVSAQKSLSYDQLRRSYKVDSRVTWDKIRSDTASHAGRVIEISGLVSGLITIQNTRTMVLRVADSTVSLVVPGNLEGAPSLRSGNGVKALAMVNRATQTSSPTAPLLTLVAVTEAPLPVPPSTRQPSAPIDESSLNPVMSLPVPPDAKPVGTPPMTSMKPLSSRGGSPIQRAQPAPETRSATPQSSGPSNEDGWMSFFRNVARQHNRKLTSQQVEIIAQSIIGAGREQGIDPRFLAAIIAVESDFNIYCLSRSGAMGLGQIMPFNLKEARITNAWDPQQNIYGMARLLKGHLNMFGSRPQGTLLAVAAYNAGPNAVKRAGYKVPNGAQVQRYVWKVYYKYKGLAPELF